MTFKNCLRLFGIVVAGSVVYALARGHAFGEALAAAALFGVFVISIALVGRFADARLKRK